MTASPGQAPPKRSLGQNFLRDENIARNIVAALNIGPEDSVLEIGPGRGALTKHILKAGPAAFRVIEKDDELAQAIRQNHPDIEVNHADALKHPWETEGRSGVLKIVGNLPYNIASPLIWEIVSRARYAAAVFMVQLEVGQRLAASPGGKEYGALSAWVQVHARPELLFKVPPHVFVPAPKVHSAVLRFVPLVNSPEPRDDAALAALLHACFQKRRKQMGTILKSYAKSDYVSALSGLGLDPSVRPETLAPEQFLALAKSLSFHFPA